MSKKKKWCCEKFKKQATVLRTLSGGISLYPSSMMPKTQYAKMADGTWAINGCCGGGCFVAEDVRYCPHCGADLIKFYGEG